MEKVKKPIFKRWWFWTAIVLILVIAVASQGGANKTTSDNSSNNSATGSTTEQSGSANASKTVSEDNNPKTSIKFDNVIVENNMGITTVYGEVSNSDSKAHSFTLKVSFYDKNKKLLGTATGAVNELNGGSSKIFSAVGAEDFSKADSYKVQVDTMVASSKNKENPIEFSNVVVKDTAGLSTVEGEAKNKDSATHSFTLVVGLYDANKKLLGVAAGAVNDIAAGETMTFTAMGTSSAKNVKSYVVQVDTMVK